MLCYLKLASGTVTILLSTKGTDCSRVATNHRNISCCWSLGFGTFNIVWQAGNKAKIVTGNTLWQLTIYRERSLPYIATFATMTVTNDRTDSWNLNCYSYQYKLCMNSLYQSHVSVVSSVWLSIILVQEVSLSIHTLNRELTAVLPAEVMATGLAGRTVYWVR